MEIQNEPDPKHSKKWLIDVLLVIAIIVFGLIMCVSIARSQEPGPTPNRDESLTTQEHLSHWWDWCMAHGNVIYRVDKKWQVKFDIGDWQDRPYMEKLKVTGALPGRPPFASMIRSQTYAPFHNGTGFAALLPQGTWNYETSDSTDIGAGSWSVHTWGAE